MGMKLIPFLTLIEREVYRFGRMATQTIVPPVLSTVLFILIFGYSLGKGIREVSGFRYILFILPGLTGMSVITNAYSNSSTSLFMARVDRSIENIIACPISPTKIAAAFILGGMIRGMAVGVVTLAAAALMTDLAIRSLALAAFYLAAVSAIFSSLGVLSGLWAEDWDHLGVFSNFVITPSIYLGGVFYSIKLLPPFWQKVSLANPMLYLIDGFRFAILGVSDIPPWTGAGIALGFVVLSVGLTGYLFRAGYKLVV